MSRAIIYTRISKDDSGEALGVARQERLSREVAARHKLNVTRVIVDNDVSAFRSRRRPGFDALVDALKAGEADALIVYHVDRLYRRLGDLERLVEVVEVTGVQVHTVAAGDVDLSTASGRMVARMLGAAAQHESERLSERTRMKSDELAARGRAPGGRAPYGYSWEATVAPDGRVERTYSPDEREADVVRLIACRVLEGASALSISRELDAAGAKTREGRPWHHSTVRAVVINPAVAGLRVHRRQIAGPGTWQPILDRATWEQVRSTLADPARKRTRPARKHILAGLVINTLGEKMNGSVSNIGQPIYSTRTPAKRSTQIPAIVLEELVIGSVLATFDKTSVPIPDAKPAEIGDQALTQLEGELAELAELRGLGKITLAEWLAAREPLQQRIDTARKAVGPSQRRITSKVAEALSVRGALRKVWPTLEFSEKREVLTIVIAAVEIGPAARGRWTTAEERTSIRWRV